MFEDEYRGNCIDVNDCSTCPFNLNAVGFIFNHTSYIKPRKTKKRKAKAA